MYEDKSVLPEPTLSNVYARVDDAARITAINSSGFLKNPDGWIQIDSGCGDKYYHAQCNYLEGGLYTADGIPRYRYDGSQVIQRTDEEIEADRAARPAPAPSPIEILQHENKLLKEQVSALSEQNDFQEELIVELATVVYA